MQLPRGPSHSQGKGSAGLVHRSHQRDTCLTAQPEPLVTLPTALPGLNHGGSPLGVAKLHAEVFAAALVKRWLWRRDRGSSSGEEEPAWRCRCWRGVGSASPAPCGGTGGQRSCPGSGASCPIPAVPQVSFLPSCVLVSPCPAAGGATRGPSAGRELLGEAQDVVASARVYVFLGVMMMMMCGFGLSSFFKLFFKSPLNVSCSGSGCGILFVFLSVLCVCQAER